MSHIYRSGNKASSYYIANRFNGNIYALVALTSSFYTVIFTLYKHFQGFRPIDFSIYVK